MPWETNQTTKINNVKYLKQVPKHTSDLQHTQDIL